MRDIIKIFVVMLVLSGVSLVYADTYYTDDNVTHFFTGGQIVEYKFSHDHLARNAVSCAINIYQGSSVDQDSTINLNLLADNYQPGDGGNPVGSFLIDTSHYFGFHISHLNVDKGFSYFHFLFTATKSNPYPYVGIKCSN